MIRMLLVVVLCLTAVAVQAGLQNQLKDHPSPYLALHGNDPVQWQQWGRTVLDRAQSENKLIYISSGYFACHWCHVMQRESYQNPEIAQLLNDHFIPVKIDRELRPALDAHLINFVEKTRGSAGWPLNVFLTPEGYPLIGLTYSPAKPFSGLLARLHQRWSDESDDLKLKAELASRVLNEHSSKEIANVAIDGVSLHVGLVTMALDLGDEMEGGFGRQSRFPMSPQWDVLIDRIAVQPHERLSTLIEFSLEQMATQGLRDHIGGGFFRYTVDPGWQVPHYEKMLYNQALMSQLFLKAAKHFDRADFRQVAKETLDFTLNVLSGQNGGYIASLSAVDVAGEEGVGYLWNAQQLRAALSEQEYAYARSRWRLEGDMITEGGYLPVDYLASVEIATELGIPAAEAMLLERRVKEKLLSARAARAHPRDGKQVAAWNALFLSALVEGIKTFDSPRYRVAAGRLRDYLVKELWDGEHLWRARANKGQLGNAALEDYVYLANALYDWGLLVDSKEDVRLAKRLVSDAWGRFFDSKKGGWVNSDDALIPGMGREQAMSDGPLPSPAAMLIDLSYRLGDEQFARKAHKATVMSHDLIAQQPIWYATQVRSVLTHLAQQKATE